MEETPIMQDNAIAISFFVSEVAANRPNFCINHEVYPTPVNEHRKRKVIQTENTTKAFIVFFRLIRPSPPLIR